MRSFRRAVMYGLVVWVVPFFVALLIRQVRDSNRPLFESIMPVVVAAVTAVMGWWYFRRVHRHYARVAVQIGLLWMVMSILFDLPLLLSPPMNWTLGYYFADIGLTYLIIPIVTIAMGLAMHSHPETVRQRLIKLDRAVEVPEFVPQL
jgi:hypothetical protein